MNKRFSYMLVEKIYRTKVKKRVTLRVLVYMRILREVELCSIRHIGTTQKSTLRY